MGVKLRACAKVIAVLELAFYGVVLLSLVLVVLLSLFLGLEVVLTGGKVKPGHHKHQKGSRHVLVTALGVGITLAVVQLLFSRGLYKATSPETDRDSALRLSDSWRIFSLIMFLLTIVALYKNPYWPYILASLVTRAVCIFIVHH